ncbi:MAG: ankyrin repeat domain-containing protein [Alphaproteobacteria bacterium]|nr:ankyrin repeat domain-containing protein [Alphaproteobacteria bacterium]
MSDQEKANSALRAALERKDAVAVCEALQCGANPDLKGKGGWRPLHYAAKYELTVVVEALLSAGAEMNAAKNDKWTPLHLAAHNNKLGVAKLLLAAGADLNAKNDEGETPEDVVRHDEMRLFFRSEVRPWRKQKEAVIAHIEHYPDLSRGITSVFNFESGQCMVITENLKTKQEAACMTDMASMNADVVRTAAEKLLEQGGDAAAVNKFIMPRKNPLRLLVEKGPAHV